jgi:hypothetical protein
MTLLTEAAPSPVDELPAYLDHWQDFADQEIRKEPSPIREHEQLRFRQQCAENGRMLRAARDTMLDNPTVINCHDWYARLGTTASLEGAEDDLNFALTTIINSPEFRTKDEETALLAGALSQELGMLSTGQRAQGYFEVAVKSYNLVIQKNAVDMRNPLVRRALAHKFDSVFTKLSYAKRDGLLSDTDFDREYQKRHVEFVQLCKGLASKNSNIPDGELYEFYGEMVLRHRLWAREAFGQAELRRAFDAREDRPRDGFRRGGRHVNQTGALPCYSFDLKLSATDGSEEPRFLQMKADADDSARYAKPTVRVIKYGLTTPLRAHVDRVAGIMLKSYAYESTNIEEAELAEIDERFSSVGA